MIFKITTHVLWNMVYALAEILQDCHIGKNIIRKTEKTISEGNPTMAKNMLLRTKNNPRRHNHIGSIGFRSSLLDISI